MSSTTRTSKPGEFYGFTCEVYSHIPWQATDAYLNGVSDEQHGNMSAPGGHLYRVDDVLVHTDEQGHMHAFVFVTPDVAEAAMQAFMDAHPEVGY